MTDRTPLLLSLTMSFAAFAAEPPAFTDLQRPPNQEIVLRFTAPAGVLWHIHASTDMSAWRGLFTLASIGVNQITDSAALYLPACYYRAQQARDSDAITGDHLDTADGDVVIHPVNHASFVIHWKDKTIYVDPVGPATRYTGLPKADLILVTHQHGDHLDAVNIAAIKADNASILAPTLVYNQSSFAGLRGITTVMNNGSSTTVAGVGTEALPAYNTTSSQHPKGVGNGYVLTIGGKRIYISGDTEDIPEMRALENIDVAFLAMNKPYTMSVAQAVGATREFRPKVVYPCHHTPSTPTTDLNAFKQQVGSDLEIEVRLRKWY